MFNFFASKQLLKRRRRSHSYRFYISYNTEMLFKFFLDLEKDRSPKKAKFSYVLLGIPFLGIYLAKLLWFRSVGYLKTHNSSMNTEGPTVSSIEKIIYEKRDKIFTSLHRFPIKLHFLIHCTERGFHVFAADKNEVVLFVKCVLNKKHEFMLESEFKNINVIQSRF